MRLASDPPAENDVTGRFVWLAYHGEEPVGLVDVERYEDGTAGLALVVCPAFRKRGLGKEILAAVVSRPELARTSVLRAGIEPANQASVGCFEGAGFEPQSEEPDEDGFIYFVYRRGPSEPEKLREKEKDLENYDPLVNPDWLERNLHDPGVRPVDIRGYVKKTDLGGGRQSAEYTGAREEYDAAHIPGAVYVDWTADITDPDDPVPAQLAPPELFAGLMGDLGIGDDMHVVVYDHTGGQFATRLWWALTFYGHDRVSVLDGGWKAWTDENRLTTDEISTPDPATFIPRPRPGWRTTAEATRAASGNGEAFILDARDVGQFTGAVTRGEGRPGHVPGAAHLHADRLLREGGGFRSEEETREILEDAGVPEDLDAPIVAYCNGGVAATVPLFALHRLGYKKLANFDGSWNEWGVREDLPAEK